MRYLLCVLLLFGAVAPSFAVYDASVVQTVDAGLTIVSGGAGARMAAQVGYRGVARWLPLTLNATRLATVAARFTYVGMAAGAAWWAYEAYFADQLVVEGDPDRTFRSDGNGGLEVETAGSAFPLPSGWPLTIWDTYPQTMVSTTPNDFGALADFKAQLESTHGGLWYSGAQKNSNDGYYYGQQYYCNNPSLNAIGYMPRYGVEIPAGSPTTAPATVDDFEEALTEDYATWPWDPLIQDLVDEANQNNMVGAISDALAGSNPDLASAPEFQEIRDTLDEAANDATDNPEIAASKAEIDAMTDAEAAAEIGDTYTQRQTSGPMTLANPHEIYNPINTKLDELPEAVATALDTKLDEQGNITIGSPDDFTTPTVDPVDQTDGLGILDSLWARVQAMPFTGYLDSIGLTTSGGTCSVSGSVTVAGSAVPVNFDLCWADAGMTAAGSILLWITTVFALWRVVA